VIKHRISARSFPCFSGFSSYVYVLGLCCCIHLWRCCSPYSEVRSDSSQQPAATSKYMNRQLICISFRALSIDQNIVVAQNQRNDLPDCLFFDILEFGRTVLYVALYRWSCHKVGSIYQIYNFPAASIRYMISRLFPREVSSSRVCSGGFWALGP